MNKNYRHTNIKTNTKIHNTITKTFKLKHLIQNIKIFNIKSMILKYNWTDFNILGIFLKCQVRERCHVVYMLLF